MQYDDKTDQITFSSGRSTYAYTGIIGIDLTDGDDTISYGADGTLDGWGWDKLTAEDRLELAEVMVKRWTSVRDRLVAESLGNIADLLAEDADLVEGVQIDD